MKFTKILTSASLLSVPLAAFSAPLSFDKEFLQNAGYLDTGPVRIYPALVTSVGYDSNIFESHRHEVDSVVTHVMPELSAYVPFNTAGLLFGVQADSSIYSQSNDDNFTDRQGFVQGQFEPGYRNRFGFKAGYAKGHDPRGTFLSEGFDPTVATIDSPDAFTNKTGSLSYEFGAHGAKGRLRFNGDYLDHSYDNHRDVTRFFDRKEVGYGAAFLWRVLPSTSLVFEDRERRINYDQSQLGESSRDSREHALLVGAEWEATAQTSGSFRVGHKTKNFSAADREDGSNFVWELGATWKPRSYSSFTLDVKRTPNESNGAGDFIDTKDYSLKWSHDWTKRIGTEMTLSHLDQSYQNADREQKSNGAQLGVRYEMRRWLTWRLDAAWRDRTSNIDTLRFDRNRYWITAQFNL